MSMALSMPMFMSICPSPCLCSCLRACACLCLCLCLRSCPYCPYYRLCLCHFHVYIQFHVDIQLHAYYFHAYVHIYILLITLSTILFYVFRTVFLGIGFIVFSLPHFIIDSYDPPQVSYPDLLCTPPAPTASPSANATTEAAACDKGLLVDWYYLALLLIGQFIAGAGTVPLYTFPPKCFQESVNQRFIPLFLAIWQGAAFLGPMIAFGVSEPILELYVDIDQVLVYY